MTKIAEVTLSSCGLHKKLQLRSCGCGATFLKKLRNCICGSASFKLRNCDCGLKKKLRLPTSEQKWDIFYQANACRIASAREKNSS